MPEGRPIKAIRKLRSAISGPERFETAAEFLLHTINDPSVVIQVRVKAAIALLAYEPPHGKRKAAQERAEAVPADSLYAPPRAPKRPN
jgi:hypothetical protein